MAQDSPARIGVLAVQGDFREHIAHLQACGAQTVRVRRPADLEGIDGLVFPGGESTAMSNLIRLHELEAPLREVVSSGLPVYGSCAGMILLAGEVLDTRPDAINFSALDITVRRNAFGRQVDSFEADIPFDAGDHIHAVFIRAPWVERVGPAAQVLAEVAGDSGEPVAVAVQQGNALVTSFHPEVTDDLSVHEHFLRMVEVNSERTSRPAAVP